MYRKLLIGAFLLSSTTMWADFNSMQFTYADGTTKTVSASGLEINIAGNILEITNANGQTFTIDAGSLTSMQFLNADESGVKAVNFTNTEVEVYGLEGVNYGKFNSLEEARALLNKGAYLLKNKAGETIKIVVK